MMVNREEAKLDTIIKFSLCCLVNSDSSVSTVIPMIPFMGVLRPISLVSHCLCTSELYHSPDLVRHVCQKFGFTPVGGFGLLPCVGVFLDTFSKIVHHLIDFRLE